MKTIKKDSDNTENHVERVSKEPVSQITISTELLTPLSIFVGAIIISASIFLGFRGLSFPANGSTAKTIDTTTTQDQQQAQAPAPDNPTVSIDKVKALFKGGAINFGDENSKLLFVEFSDPSCPYCHIAGGKNPELNKQVGQRFALKADGGSYVAPVPEMKKLVDEGKAAFVWIYTNGHGNGELATESLYCAKEKGKFWEAHDLLMSSSGYSIINDVVKNDRSKSPELAEFLSSVVDTSFMQSCLESKKYNAKIAENQNLANDMGVSGTPGFFVNDTNFAGAYSFDDMQSTVSKVLSE